MEQDRKEQDPLGADWDLVVAVTLKDVEPE